MGRTTPPKSPKPPLPPKPRSTTITAKMPPPRNPNWAYDINGNRMPGGYGQATGLGLPPAFTASQTKNWQRVGRVKPSAGMGLKRK